MSDNEGHRAFVLQLYREIVISEWFSLWVCCGIMFAIVIFGTGDIQTDVILVDLRLHISTNSWYSYLNAEAFFCILFYRDSSNPWCLQDILMASRAPSTVKKYRKAFNDWKSWCAVNSVCELPAQKDCIARYYTSLYNNGAPYSRIESAHFGIRWYHDCSSIVDVNPCNSKFLQLLLAGLKRLMTHPRCKKEPITPDIYSVRLL
jgi:hypothetical protein